MNREGARRRVRLQPVVIQQLFWARLPGDTLIILGTVVFAYDMVKKRFTLRDVSAPSETPGSGTIPDRVMAEDDD